MLKSQTKEVLKEVVADEIKEVFPAGDIPVHEIAITKDEVNPDTGEITKMLFNFEEVKDLITRSILDSKKRVKTNKDMLLEVKNPQSDKVLSSVPPALPLNVGKPLSLKETLLRFGGNLKDQLTTLSQMPGILNNVPESDMVYDFTGVAMENHAMQTLNPYYVDDETDTTMQERVNALYVEKQKLVDDSLSNLTPDQLRDAIALYQASQSVQDANTEGSTASGSAGVGTQPEPQA